MEVNVKIRIITLASVGILALAGCSSSPQQAGSAAIVGKVAITESAVTEWVTAARTEITNLPVEAVAQAPSLTQLGQMTIDRLVLSELLKSASEVNGITVTSGEVNTLLNDAYAEYGKEQILAQLVVQNGIPSEQLDEFGRDVVIQRKLMAALDPAGDANSQSAALGAYLADLSSNVGVSLSPRYGVWSAENVSSIPGDNALSVAIAPAS